LSVLFCLTVSCPVFLLPVLLSAFFSLSCCLLSAACFVVSFLQPVLLSTFFSLSCCLLSSACLVVCFLQSVCFLHITVFRLSDCCISVTSIAHSFSSSACISTISSALLGAACLFCVRLSVSCPSLPVRFLCAMCTYISLSLVCLSPFCLFTLCYGFAAHLSASCSICHLGSCSLSGCCLYFTFCILFLPLLHVFSFCLCLPPPCSHCLSVFLKRDFFGFFLFMYDIQHCFICRP